MPNGTTLALYQEGLDVLRLIEGPLAPVVVIGPYRSSHWTQDSAFVGCEACMLKGASIDLVTGY